MVAPSWPMETGRLLLRPFEAGDLAALHAIHSDASVAQWLYNEPRTLEDSRELLGRKVAGSALRGEHEWLSAAVVLRESRELVADVSLLWASETHRKGELGFIVHPAHQGKGYATEASRPMLDFAFATLGLHRVVGRLEPRNTSSARVLEKLGIARPISSRTSGSRGNGRASSPTRSSPASGATGLLARSPATPDTELLADDGGPTTCHFHSASPFCRTRRPRGSWSS